MCYIYRDIFIHNLYSIYWDFCHIQYMCSWIMFLLQNCAMKITGLVGKNRVGQKFKTNVTFKPEH